MSALILWLNIPLMMLAFGLVAGLPLWMVLRRPDRNPAETRTVPAYVAPRTGARTGARTGVRAGVPGPRVIPVMVPAVQH